MKIHEATLEQIKDPANNNTFIWEHGVQRTLPLAQIVPNDYNFNEMSPEEFDLLDQNVQEVDFLDPILVTPILNNDAGPQKFRIIDGEHRYTQQKIEDRKEIPCIIVDPERFNEKEQMRQTARMNKIKGHINKEKFQRFVTSLITDHGYTMDTLANELGFAEQKEFDSLVAQAKESLPNKEAKDEFDQLKKEIKTVDDLSELITNLINKYGNTLPSNFMAFDFGGKDTLWIRLQKSDYKKVLKQSNICSDEKVTFDSVLLLLLKKLDMRKFISSYREVLVQVSAEDTPNLEEVM